MSGIVKLFIDIMNNNNSILPLSNDVFICNFNSLKNIIGIDNAVRYFDGSKDALFMAGVVGDDVVIEGFNILPFEKCIVSKGTKFMLDKEGIIHFINKNRLN